MLLRVSSPRFRPTASRSLPDRPTPTSFMTATTRSLRVMPIAGGQPRTLVEGMRDLEMPRWSPDGRTLAFIAKVGKRESQIYTVPVSGGTPTELSDAANGVQQYSWSPDGSTIAYVTPDDSPLSDRDRRTHHDLFTIQHDDYLVDKPAVRRTSGCSP